jgi:hypothetical protein
MASTEDVTMGKTGLLLLGVLACGDIAYDTDGADRHPCGIRSIRL